MRIVYMGTPDFAVESLKALVEGGYNVVGVVTNLDKRSGRGQKVTQSAVKIYAEEQGLKVLQTPKFRDENFLSELRELKADLQIVVAFKMLPEIVWSMPPMGTFNLHASLLPRYRGAAPLNWAVINGDRATGATTFLLKHEIDTGSVLMQREIEISNDDTVGDVHDSLMYLGAELVCKTVDGLSDGSITPMSQEELIEKGFEERHAPKIFKDDCLINWGNSTSTVHNHIRGLSPYPAAWCNLTPLVEGEKRTTAKILLSKPILVEHNREVGFIDTDSKSYIHIYCKDGYIDVLEIQLAGKKRLKSADLLRGFRTIDSYRAD